MTPGRADPTGRSLPIGRKPSIPLRRFCCRALCPSPAVQTPGLFRLRCDQARRGGRGLLLQQIQIYRMQMQTLERKGATQGRWASMEDPLK